MRNSRCWTPLVLTLLLAKEFPEVLQLPLRHFLFCFRGDRSRSWFECAITVVLAAHAHDAFEYRINFQLHLPVILRNFQLINKIHCLLLPEIQLLLILKIEGFKCAVIDVVDL